MNWRSPVIYLIFPYFLAVAIIYCFPNLQDNKISSEFLPLWLSYTSKILQDKTKSPTNLVSEISWQVSCYQQFLDKIGVIHPTVSVALHFNGQAEPCNIIIVKELLNDSNVLSTLRLLDKCPDWESQYFTDSFLTRLLHDLSSLACSIEDQHPGLHQFCDRGLKRTPILRDHRLLVPYKLTEDGPSYLPCHFHNASGYRLSSVSLLREWIQDMSCQQEDYTAGKTCRGHPTLELYAVPAGRHFMFAPKYIGEIIPLPHVPGADPTQPVNLEVLSVSPRVFDLVNFVSKQESEDLVERALAETRESYRLQRSTTGSNGREINRYRTSETAFDAAGETAMNIKRRSFAVLGMGNYIESYADGVQILRYRNGTAYQKHLDWIEPNTRSQHNYDSAGQGSNRFATLLLYMNDIEANQGGETVFANAWPLDVAETKRLSLEQAKSQLLESEFSNFLTQGSWEEDLAVWCRSRLAIRPKSARTVLFYSQLPDGQKDESSQHGACPVFNTTKVKYGVICWWSTESL
ncbi:hypothetical protein FisN_21Hh011 [Fistulifera solaris]|uniref:Fe2OG dioxygenase domain-containing protein n=1 Tax=Fistulifera solaris TaxID=1519565 RepID=A0A1Z5KAK9_FISSO|nr:hypothetical protein FisN_21Hh011 [Fistulifera solaris]|eukprot:GAX23303.1 hypothetical protein FisN_21Hh011 [Fistulifera solaris]